MIYVQMRGGCGNQLFQYAAARCLWEKTDKQTKICINFPEPEQYTFALNEFRITPFVLIHEKDSMIRKYASLQQKIIVKLYKYRNRRRWPPYKDLGELYRRESTLQPWINRYGLYMLIQGYSPMQLSEKANWFLEGNFESRQICDEIRDILIEEYQPVSSIQPASIPLYNYIRNNNSVCISIRSKWRVGPYQATRNICDAEYFIKAICLMKELLADPVFIVFSDDIKWAKENIRTNVNCIFEDGAASVAEKLQMMSSCKHFIISNSSFSWWAQYLSRNNEKKVISPSKWSLKAGFPNPLIDDDFVKI